MLGMTVIDEPAAKQTDPAVFKLALKMEQKSITDETHEEVSVTSTFIVIAASRDGNGSKGSPKLDGLMGFDPSYF